jgi:ABC-type antimicrobial peptide transport system permease subunit
VVDEAVPYVYLPAAQNAGVGIATGTHLVARGSGSPAETLAALRAALRDFDPSLPTYDARLIASQMNRVLMPQRFGALLLGLLAAVTLAISAIGVYAMVSFGVRRRTREIGIRMALGAEPRRVMVESVRRAGHALLAGVAIGVALAAGLVRFITAWIHGIEPLDVGSFGTAAVVLVTASLIAALRPALGAARIDPDLALRQER